MTDWRERCAALVDEIDYTWGDIPDDLFVLLDRTRAELAQPEPKGVTDGEIEEAAKLIHASIRFAVPHIYTTCDWVECGNSLMQNEARRTARAVLARYARPAIAAELEGGND